MTDTATLDPPAAPPAPAAAMIPLDRITESPHNPRKHYGDLTELVESIRRQGVLQPVLVRPLDEDRFELVFGHRRTRAAREAGLAEIPAMVRDMTDLEVLEAQLVENCQRADIHPMEEAEGYQRLHEQHGYAVDDIAAKVGKSKAYVYGRMKLCALVPAARPAFLEGRLTPSVALLLARIPDSKAQKKATEEVLRGRWIDSREPMTYAAAAEHIHDNYMLRLKEARFAPTDATLLPEAGPCTTCPKRTGNQALLFQDVKSADVCTDPACFREKTLAAAERRKQQAIEAGQVVLEGKKAEAAIREGQYGDKYVDLDKTTYDGSWRKQMAKKEVPVVLAIDPQTGEVHELVRRADLPSNVRQLESFTTQAAAKDQAKQRRRHETARRAIAAVIEKARAQEIDERWWRFVASQLAEDCLHDTAKAVCARRELAPAKKSGRRSGFDPRGTLAEFAANAPAAELPVLLLELVITRFAVPGVWSREAYGKALRFGCSLFGVDLGAIEKEVAGAQEKPKSKKAKEPANKKPAQKETTPAVPRGRRAAKAGAKRKRNQ